MKLFFLMIKGFLFPI